MKTVAANRRARFDYELLENVEAGVVLTGQEVKSCRLGQVSLAGSYVSFLHGRPVIKGMKISPYAYASGLEGYDPGHDRPLLLNASQAAKLEAASAEKGMSVIPLEVRAGKWIKILIGIARGRKRIDKRQRIREREVEKRIRRKTEY